MQNKFTQCRHGFADIRPDLPEKIVRVCRKDADNPVPINNKTVCEACPHFKSKYIQYPITVKEIINRPIEDSRKDKIGSPVKIQICQEDGKVSRSYDGIFMGELCIEIHTAYNEQTQTVINTPISNPAIYVPELKRLVYGYESFWSFTG